MINKSSNVVPGTQLCYRALYATIVGEQPLDCLPGTSVKMSENGPVLVDHVMRVARPYIPNESRRGYNNNNINTINNNNNTMMTGESPAAAEEMRNALIDLRRQNRQYHRDLETCTQQLEMRKQEVQALQNKLRVVHMQARKLGYDFHDLADKGNTNNNNNSSSGGSNTNTIRNGYSNNNNSSNGSRNGEHTRPPLPPLRLDINKHGPLASPPPHTITTTTTTTTTNNNNNRNSSNSNSNSNASTSTSTTTTTSSNSHPSSNSTTSGGPVTLQTTLTTTPPLPPIFQQDSTQDINSLTTDRGGTMNSLSASDTVAAATREETPQVVENDTMKKEMEVLESNNSSSIIHSTSMNRKNGISLPVLPQHLLSSNPGAMLFCHHCCLFLAPHPVNISNHLQSEGHHCNVKTPLTSGLTYTQFGKLVQRMPSFIEAVTVVSEEQRLRETAAGNHFFDSGLDIVHSICSLCQEIVTTQSYKVHESLASHRRRAMKTKEDASAV
ncbi:uncharacterized protein TM35_000151650 [Trypanosoma theileri]|uniref:Uncharacterized protein n=1 Tax=Trypanosoma theileri TaxID=67003 RepID=A0A1X0NVJ7_9TRYP|nr:uncharacterized protein TM35_000151650 [Trypanosoma theileri]ORC88734.1 hypothetical protein TM35_000151650 [Trypanosoma theileri]